MKVFPENSTGPQKAVWVVAGISSSLMAGFIFWACIAHRGELIASSNQHQTHDEWWVAGGTFLALVLGPLLRKAWKRHGDRAESKSFGGWNR
jgi:hypothetical protein